MNDREKIIFKESLKSKALEILHARVDHSNSSMNEAQHAANEEDKRAVGDKHETARAMALIDRDIHARQLGSAQKDLSFIQQIDVSFLHRKIEVGAFAETNKGKYFFLTGLGAIDINGEKVFYLSISSPLGKNLDGKKAGESALFNGMNLEIVEVF